jgi:CHAD domain-containing protein
MAAHETIHEYYLHQHRNIEHYLELCAGHPEAELVHQLRLSIKKLRAFNILAEQFGHSDVVENIHIKHRIKHLFKLAGQLRDTQVQIRLLSLFEEQTDTLFPEFSKWLLSREKNRIERFGNKPQQVVPQSSAHITHQNIGEMLSQTNDEIIVKGANEVLTVLLLKAQKLAEGTISDPDLHRIRIITKQLKYILNIILHSYPDFSFDLVSVDSLRDIEAATGHWHDCLVKVKLLSKCMGKMQSADNSTLLKYQKFLGICYSELQIAYQDACKLVRKVLIKEFQEEELF